MKERSAYLYISVQLAMKKGRQKKNRNIKFVAHYGKDIKTCNHECPTIMLESTDADRCHMKKQFQGHNYVVITIYLFRFHNNISIYVKIATQLVVNIT